jgi:NAD(P)-dependent dehydrogenase (short-subunit alcohol dehydrogenase family)
MFPALAETQLPDALAALLASTRVVGMKVPGEHSVFLQLDLVFEPQPENSGPFTYRVAEYRKSSQRLGIAIAGAASHGMLWALVRPAPVAQPDMAVVRQQISPGRFRGQRVIVIGGSRGLGEIAAKVLAAGGAEVALSYRLGGDDAKRVTADIAAGGGRALAFQLDTGSPDWEQNLTANCPHYTHLCYFPTPPIVGGDGSTFNGELFAKFCDVYVAGFVNVAQWLAKQNGGQFALFNASSVYVEAPPLRQLEYAAAKAASEACCRWLAAAYPKSRVYAARFPRLNTDQTASFLTASEHDNLQTMLGELSAWLPA